MAPFEDRNKSAVFSNFCLYHLLVIILVAESFAIEQAPGGSQGCQSSHTGNGSTG